MKLSQIVVTALIAAVVSGLMVWLVKDGFPFARSNSGTGNPSEGSGARKAVEELRSENLPLAQAKKRIALLSKEDPASAISYVAELSPGPRRRKLVETITRNIKLARAEPLIMLIDSSDDYHEHYEIWRLSNRFGRAFEPRWALELRAKCSHEDVRRHLLGHAAKQSLRTGDNGDPISVEQSLVWLEKQEADLQPALRQEITRVLARLEPQSALDLMRENDEFKPSPAYGKRLAQEFGLKGPEIASDWVVGAAREMKQPAMVSEFTSAWLKHDSLAASQWVDGLPEGPERQAAIRSLVAYLEESGDSETAKIWRAQLQEPSDDTTRDDQ